MQQELGHPDPILAKSRTTRKTAKDLLAALLAHLPATDPQAAATVQASAAEPSLIAVYLFFGPWPFRSDTLAKRLLKLLGHVGDPGVFGSFEDLYWKILEAQQPQRNEPTLPSQRVFCLAETRHSKYGFKLTARSLQELENRVNRVHLEQETDAPEDDAPADDAATLVLEKGKHFFSPHSPSISHRKTRPFFD